MSDRRRFLGLAAAALALASAPRASAQSDDAARRRAGAHILVGFVGIGAGDSGVRQVAQDLAMGRIAGVVLFQRNIRSSGQLRRLLTLLREATRGAPPIIAIDNEGGAATRTEGARGFKSWQAAQQVVARCGGDEACVHDYYLPRAQQLARAGITLNLAPVTDLNINPRNPIIGGLGRSFSADPAVVIAAARQFVRAHRAAGVATCLKHFPGHGSSRTDSHRGLPDVTQSWQDAELLPFAALVSEGAADTVMMAHLYHARLSDGRFQPTSLSKTAVGVLRSDMGFDGVVITDDLQMGAVQNAYDLEGAAGLALAAGNDLLIYGNFSNPDPGLGARVNAAVQAAQTAGLVTPEAVEASARRLARLRS